MTLRTINDVANYLENRMKIRHCISLGTELSATDFKKKYDIDDDS